MPQSASCSENFVIPPDVFGQTLRARKSRWRVGTVDNYGEYALTDLHTNYIVAGERFNLSADEVIALCKEEAA